MAKKNKRKRATAQRRATTQHTLSAPQAVEETAQRLEKLSEELEDASREAKQVAEIVRNDLATAISEHLVDAASKPQRKSE